MRNLGALHAVQTWPLFRGDQTISGSEDIKMELPNIPLVGNLVFRLDMDVEGGSDLLYVTVLDPNGKQITQANNPGIWTWTNATGTPYIYIITIGPRVFPLTLPEGYTLAGVGIRSFGGGTSVVRAVDLEVTMPVKLIPPPYSLNGFANVLGGGSGETRRKGAARVANIPGDDHLWLAVGAPLRPHPARRYWGNVRPDGGGVVRNPFGLRREHHRVAPHPRTQRPLEGHHHPSRNTHPMDRGVRHTAHAVSADGERGGRGQTTLGHNPKTLILMGSGGPEPGLTTVTTNGAPPRYPCKRGVV